MKKKGPLDVAETYYIEGHAATKSVKEISEDLNRTMHMVNKHLGTLPEIELAQVNVEGDVPKMPIASDLLTRNNRYGAVAMTEEASGLGDENRRIRLGMPPRTQECVTTTRRPDA
jgi:hypothetical protein